MLMTEPQHIPRAHQLGLLNTVESEVIQSMRVNNLKELTISFDPSEAYQDITYTWSKNIKQEDMEHVMNQFLGKKHVALTMKSNDVRPFNMNTRTVNEYTTNDTGIE